MKVPTRLVCLFAVALAVLGASTTCAFAATLDPATVNVTWDDNGNAENLRASFDIEVFADMDGRSISVDTLIAGTSDATYTTASTVDADSYVVKATAPVGYVTTVTKDASSAGNVFNVTASITTTTITCLGVDGAPLTGAEFQVCTPSGDIARTVTTDNGEATVYGLVAGLDYVLHQVAAPEGYALAMDVEFTTSAATAHTSVSVSVPTADPEVAPSSDVVVAPSSSVVQGAASSATQIPATGDKSMLAVALTAMASACCLLGAAALRRKLG